MKLKKKAVKIKRKQSNICFLKWICYELVYFETGELLSKAGREYGKSIIKNYLIKLIKEVDKKYNEEHFEEKWS